MRMYPHTTLDHTHVHIDTSLHTILCKCMIFLACVLRCITRTYVRMKHTHAYRGNEDARARVHMHRVLRQRTRRPVSVWKLQGCTPSHNTYASYPCVTMYIPQTTLSVLVVSHFYYLATGTHDGMRNGPRAVNGWRTNESG